MGVDGCRAGWLWVWLGQSGEWQAGVEQSFHQVWSRSERGDLILVDIPIGLRDSGDLERLCDREARGILGRLRSSSVFPVPCRQSLHGKGYGDACRINERLSGRRLSRQSWNIAAKIREVDDLLQTHPRARRMVLETHPEVLFWSLNGGKSMQHNKRTAKGFNERLRLLTRQYPGSQAILAFVMDAFERRQAGRDDVLDAIAAAVAAKQGRRSLRSFPGRPELDSAGLPMRIVYPRFPSPVHGPEANPAWR
jgi:predicted RNase H-like nuclease